MALMAAVMDLLSYVMSFSRLNFVEPEAAGHGIAMTLSFNVDLF